MIIVTFIFYTSLSLFCFSRLLLPFHYWKEEIHACSYNLYRKREEEKEREGVGEGEENREEETMEEEKKKGEKRKLKK